MFTIGYYEKVSRRSKKILSSIRRKILKEIDINICYFNQRLIKKLRESSYSEVIEHWQIVEEINNLEMSHRKELIVPLKNATWYYCKIDSSDINQIHIISSSDWIDDGLCPEYNFSLKQVVEEFSKKPVNFNDKTLNILEKIRNFINNINSINKEFVLVSESEEGPFTIIEGNKRCVALAYLNKLTSIEIYLGVTNLSTYKWSSCTPRK